MRLLRGVSVSFNKVSYAYFFIPLIPTKAGVVMDFCLFTDLRAIEACVSTRVYGVSSNILAAPSVGLTTKSDNAGMHGSRATCFYFKK